VVVKRAQGAVPARARQPFFAVSATGAVLGRCRRDIVDFFPDQRRAPSFGSEACLLAARFYIREERLFKFTASCKPPHP
jgi:hypothetical protein